MLIKVFKSPFRWPINILDVVNHPKSFGAATPSVGVHTTQLNHVVSASPCTHNPFAPFYLVPRSFTGTMSITKGMAVCPRAAAQGPKTAEAGWRASLPTHTEAGTPRTCAQLLQVAGEHQHQRQGCIFRTLSIRIKLAAH